MSRCLPIKYITLCNIVKQKMGTFWDVAATDAGRETQRGNVSIENYFTIGMSDLARMPGVTGQHFTPAYFLFCNPLLYSIYL